MNKKQLIDFLEDYQQHAENATEKELVGASYRQQLLIDNINQIISTEDKEKKWLFHMTSAEKGVDIFTDGLLLPKKYRPHDFLKNYDFRFDFRSCIETEGHSEDFQMRTYLHKCLDYIEELQEKNNYNQEEILEFQRRIFVLDKLKDSRSKLFLHDNPNFVLTWDQNSLNIHNKGTVLLCIDKTKVNYLRKNFYIEPMNLPKWSQILYYMDDDHEQFIKNFVKTRAISKNYEFVSYEPISTNDITFIIIIDQFKITHLLKREGNNLKFLERREYEKNISY